MKIKKIAGLCRKNKRFDLLRERSREGNVLRQWLGDGRAMYPLDGMPVMDEDSLRALFDIPEKDRDKIKIQSVVLPDWVHTGDDDPEERELGDGYPEILHQGAALSCLESGDGFLFLDNRYLSPLEDLEALRFFVREQPEGRKYIAVKAGWMLRAVVLPYEIWGKDFFVKLGVVARRCMAEERETQRRDSGETILFENLE